jgi:DNA (cytosine-5)-methyltransferase 1
MIKFALLLETNHIRVSYAMLNGNQKPPTFIDLFAGCGGLSLGMTMAGWQGIFAIEKADDAFKTFEANFLNGDLRTRFSWPKWLERRAHSIEDVLKEHNAEIRRLKGSIDVVAGGPPCQGFSLAGRRNKNDPRNKLFEQYVQFVSDVRPKAIVLENVNGMQIAHGASGRGKCVRPGPKAKSYYQKLVDALDDIGYVAEGWIINAADHCVPQHRPRLVVIGLQRSIEKRLNGGISSAIDFIRASGIQQRDELGFPDRLSSHEAISDLEIRGRPLLECMDPASRKGFFVPTYDGPTTRYQRWANEGIANDSMDSMRLTRHRELVLEKFETILRECRKGVSVSEVDRARLGILKHRTVPMAPDKPAPTVTTLPDDILHYCEPRILSVRECARLQTFPDWFRFLGNYTTGGMRRKKECPRYTQVGNAVPPLLARSVGMAVRRVLAETTAEFAETTSSMPRTRPNNSAKANLVLVDG